MLTPLGPDALKAHVAQLVASETVVPAGKTGALVTVINAKARNHSNTPRWGSSSWHDLWLAE